MLISWCFRKGYFSHLYNLPFRDKKIRDFESLLIGDNNCYKYCRFLRSYHSDFTVCSESTWILSIYFAEINKFKKKKKTFDKKTVGAYSFRSKRQTSRLNTQRYIWIVEIIWLLYSCHLQHKYEYNTFQIKLYTS